MKRNPAKCRVFSASLPRLFRRDAIFALVCPAKEMSGMLVVFSAKIGIYRSFTGDFMLSFQ